MKLLKPINYRNIKNINLDDFHEKMEQLGVDKSFVVAVSGGPDSLALMFLAKEYSLKKNIKFFIYGIDFRWIFVISYTISVFNPD